VSYELECPKCEEWIEISTSFGEITCPECNASWTIDTDAEFVDGQWRDLTKLHPIK
jgi:Zn finger protein HypA/HybF involved in hydrogenase expression